MRLRKHQEEARRLALECEDKIVVAHVTPGGGKTLMASVFAHELLRRGEVAQVVVLSPRDSLRAQMAEGFTEPRLGLDCHVVVWEPKSSPRQTRMGDNVVGVVTTYQSAVVHISRLQKLVRSAPTLLVLDELHHLSGSEDGDDSDEEMAQWLAVVQPLVEDAKRVLAMTGTIYRSDGEPIPFVPYEDKIPRPHLSYTRQNALDEEAVLPIEFRMWDGKASYEYRGEKFEERLSTSTGEASRSLRTALSDTTDDGYSLAFLQNAMKEWQEYRRTTYQSKAIVVCVSQEMARWANRSVISMGYKSALAISDEPGSAMRVTSFRKRSDVDVLVTVGMAYEGLDVPSATHLVLLTNRRARPWLDQAVARATRVNRDCSIASHEQFAYVWISDDVAARKYVEEMHIEQCEIAEARKKREGVGVPRGPSTFKPGDAVATDRNLFSERLGRASDSDQKKIDRIVSLAPELGARPLHELLSIVRGLESTFGEARP